MLHAGGDSTSAFGEISDHLGSPKFAVFLPYALRDWEGYTTAAQERRFDPIGVTLHGLHRFDDPAGAIRRADAIIVGGGNSFRLVDAIHNLGLIDPVREMVASGVPYYGGSAGANVGCPTIRTTNDMPIIQPASLTAFGLVPFQINPHYVDAAAPDLRMGETREERILQFLEENDAAVVGLREGSWLRILGTAAELRGGAGAVLFRRRTAIEHLQPWSDVSFLLEEQPRYDDPMEH